MKKGQAWDLSGGIGKRLELLGGFFVSKGESLFLL